MLVYPQMEHSVINLKGVSKVYFGNNKKKLKALDNVNLEITKGSKVGLIGANGAGKSTLLKTIAGITSPTSGLVEVRGKIVSLMDLESGFNPDLSGEENIYLNGVLAGMTSKEIRNKFSSIIKFADIGNFLDAPFYTYSNGMKFRLAFSVAVASRCDVLIIDEIFASGDSEFQYKTYDKLKMLQQSGVTSIVSSHIAALVWGFSDVFYEMSKGKLKTKPKREMRKMVLEEQKRWQKSMRLT